MVIEATRSMMNGLGDLTLARSAQPMAAQAAAEWDEDLLFTCPDRDAAGFVPSNR